MKIKAMLIPVILVVGLCVLSSLCMWGLQSGLLFQQWWLAALVLNSTFIVGVACYIGLSRQRLCKMQRLIEQLEQGNFSGRLAERGWDASPELTRLANQLAARLEGLIQSQRELTSAVSHELRTPIARLQLRLEMLQMSRSDEDRQQRIEDMGRDLNELLRLVDELLTYARLDKGGPPLHFNWHNFNEIVLEVVERLDCIKKDKQLIVRQKAPENCQIYAEARFLQRAIQNYLTNALRYSKGRVEISWGTLEQGWFFRVDDDGPGIPEEQRQSIFSPFVRLDKSRSRVTGGYGIGLAIVARIAEWHEGDVRVETSHLLGARFVFEWQKSETATAAIKKAS